MNSNIELEAFDPDQSEQGDLLAWYEFAIAVRKDEKPDRRTLPFDEWIDDLRLPDAGRGPREFWGARLDGELVATAQVYLLEGESDQVALTSITVAPDRRRAGVGTTVLHLLLPLLEARGRTVVEGWDLAEDGPGHRWATAVGLRTAKSMVVQWLHPADVDPATWDVPVPAGYRVVDWSGVVPDELVDSFARALTAMRDAPIGTSGVPFPVWTVDRVREAEAELRESGIDRRGVLAVNELTGEVAALTLLDFYPTLPTWGVQRDTVVVPSERGHGLGLYVKARMLRWLREQRPEIDRVHTGTGSDNEHMIRINHLLGYRTTGVSVGVNAKISDLRDRGVEVAVQEIE
ncbi:GNAT family N-acetyltransferase [Lentzea sp. BCCO 10_0061]|uniref:GNAT family N-acetyltransferase n=1 Tax=Lentzea sokolovensis TaxID=3095429 RepID=A0ABU4V5F1_9PSEU|nr:GNAT family N-acetyltransferase [Lentzea sp. BCCO 10_0061]MDX8146949.1 GNAT family N-acetyltransferase [Lentzea sp. BCCO 10_0061]